MNRGPIILVCQRSTGGNLPDDFSSDDRWGGSEHRKGFCLKLLSSNFQYLLDQMPPPELEDDELVKKLRQRLRDLLSDLRAGAEGTNPLKQTA
ncbi:hypothetical protein B0H16DRAFT_274181 [Mycena metata]|uniref:Uncharacterized protein n=1 Tax=Mycena metata TaxID=1033252 RepID=A0AAD7JP64_9AGAR|nr:hypothetical protein B0H16DRAFT_274181 [Mycena metata]